MVLVEDFALEFVELETLLVLMAVEVELGFELVIEVEVAFELALADFVVKNFATDSKLEAKGSACLEN